MATFLKPVYIK